MDTADTPATTRDAPPPTAPATPTPIDPNLVDVPAIRSLIRACAPGWTAQLTRARGPLDVTALSEDTDSDGHRRRVQRVETVDSILARLHHPAHHAAAVAMWVRREGKGTPGKAGSGYAFDMAFRGRHPDEHGPVPLTATELRAYVATTGATAPLELDLEAAA